MTPRQEIIVTGTASFVTTVFLTAGILAWGWSPVLLFVVPFFGGPILVGWFEWLKSDTRARRRQARIERRHQPAGTR